MTSALNAITSELSDVQQRQLRALKATVSLAARLDTWARVRYRLPRVDALRRPSGVDPAAWSEWVKALEQLRFAPSPSDGYAALAALCETARDWERHV